MPSSLQSSYINSLQNTGYNPQSGGSLGLQGNSQPAQNTVQQPTIPKKVVYGNNSATSPKQQFMDSITPQNPLAASGTDPNAALFAANKNNLSAPASNPLDNAKSTYLNSLTGGSPPSTPTQTTPFAQQLQTLTGNLQTAQSNQGTLTPEALKAQQDLNTFRGQEQQGILALSGRGEGIPLGLVRGQQGKLLQQGQIQEQTLQNEFSNAQTQSIAKRAGDVSAAQTALGFYNPAPVQVGLGSNLARFNPSTGGYDTVAQGQDYAAKIGTQTLNDLINAYPDAGILPTDNLQTAQAKASSSQSFANKASQVQTIANPLTGSISVIPTKSYNSANSASVQNYNNPQNGTKFTLGSDGKTVLANGTPIDLNTFRQMTGQTGANTDFSAIQNNQNLGGARSSGGTIQTNPNDVYNLDLAKGLANTSSQIIGQTAQTSIGLNNLTQTGQLLVNSMKQLGLNPNDYPTLNSIENVIKSKNGNAGAVAAFRNSVQTLRSDYSAVLGARGNLTPSQISSEVDRSIPENLSPSQLQQVIDRVQAEGGINLNNQTGALNTIRNSITNIPFNSGQAAQVPNFGGSQSTPSSLFNGLF